MFKFIIKRLRDQGLAVDQIMKPSEVGLHRCNRGQYGANEETVHLLGGDIAHCGWDDDEIVNPIAVEDGPDRNIEKDNMAMVKDSEKLAPVIQHSIRAGSLTNGHTVQLLRCILAGVPSEVKALSVNGRMSLAHVAARDPDFARAATEGWSWLLLKSPTATIYGDTLFEFLSETKNISVARAETEVTALLKIHKRACSFKAAGKPIEWDVIALHICRSKPPCAESVPALISFVKLYGGTAESQFVRDFHLFHRRFVSNDCFVGSAFYESLSSVTFKGKDGVVHILALLIWAILKTQYRCPPSKIVQRECCFISSADLSTLPKKNLKQALDADAILTTSRKLAIQAGSALTETARIKAFGLLDTNLVRVLLNKQKDSANVYNTMEEAACDFFDNLVESAPDAALGDNPWSSNRKASSSSSSQPPTTKLNNPAVPDMRAYTAAGDVIPIDGKRILQEHRFDVGSIVCRKKESSIKLEIVTLGNPVEIKDAAGKLEQIDLPDFFKNFMKYEEEFVDLTGGHASDKHEAFQINVVKSKVCLALDALSKQVGNMDLAMQLKPSKKLTAVSEFKPEECILVPCTSNVLAIKDGQDRPTTAIPVDIKSEALQDMSFCLASMPMSLNKEAKANLNVPFWAVKSTAKIDEANMYSTSVPVSISLKVDKNIQHDTIHVPVLKKPITSERWRRAEDLHGKRQWR